MDTKELKFIRINERLFEIEEEMEIVQKKIKKIEISNKKVVIKSILTICVYLLLPICVFLSMRGSNQGLLFIVDFDLKEYALDSFVSLMFFHTIFLTSTLCLVAGLLFAMIPYKKIKYLIKIRRIRNIKKMKKDKRFKRKELFNLKIEKEVKRKTIQLSDEFKKLEKERKVLLSKLDKPTLEKEAIKEILKGNIPYTGKMYVKDLKLAKEDKKELLYYCDKMMINLNERR